MVVKFNPARPRDHGVRTQEGSVGRSRGLDARHPATPARRRQFPPADRRDLGHAGQHLHQRRLHQLARGQVRQERRLGEVVGREGQQAGRVRHAAQHRRRRARQHLRRRPRQPAHPGVRSGRQVSARDEGHRRAGAGRRAAGDRQPSGGGHRGDAAAGAPWAICITPGPNQVLYTSDSYPAASTSSRSTARCWACSARPASSRSSSDGFTRWRARRRTSCTSPRSSTGACRSSRCIRTTGRRRADSGLSGYRLRLGTEMRGFGLCGIACRTLSVAALRAQSPIPRLD